ncbi:MAG: hypothetical protein QOI63_929, partial [Thermoplasmata archaeon]|nr:hypothetical protein [Thermoplasmata archaeon]
FRDDLPLDEARRQLHAGKRRWEA